MKRHFTVSAFVSSHGQTLLHWHEKNRMWLPPGGHIEPDEDPYQAALREVEEETGLSTVILPTVDPYGYDAPEQLPVPATIMVEDIPANPSEPAHQHLDLIYFARPLSHDLPEPPNGVWHWITAETLRDNKAITSSDGTGQAWVAEDVRVLGLAAIQRAAQEQG